MDNWSVTVDKPAPARRAVRVKRDPRRRLPSSRPQPRAKVSAVEVKPPQASSAQVGAWICFAIQAMGVLLIPVGGTLGLIGIVLGNVFGFGVIAMAIMRMAQGDVTGGVVLLFATAGAECAAWCLFLRPLLGA